MELCCPNPSFKKAGPPNSASIRFRLSRFADEKTLEDSGYKFGKFVDLSIYKPETSMKYSVSPVVKGYDYMSQNLDSNYAAAVNEIPGLDAAHVEWILGEYQRANQAGYSNLHPFGKDPGFAEKQIEELRAALSAGDYQWNDREIKGMAAAKAGLYLWRLENKSEESLEYINGVLATMDYDSLFERMTATMGSALPSQFPAFQMSSQ